MHPLVRALLEREQADGVQIALVVAPCVARQDRLGEVLCLGGGLVGRHGRSILRPCPISSPTRSRALGGLRAAGPARAAAHARRARRPAARARARLGAAPLDRGGSTPLADPLRPAGRRQDDARADRRGDDRRGVRGAVRGLRPRGRRPPVLEPRASGSAGTGSARSSSSTRSTASTRPSRTRFCPAVEDGLIMLIGGPPRTRSSRSTRRCSAGPGVRARAARRGGAAGVVGAAPRRRRGGAGRCAVTSRAAPAVTPAPRSTGSSSPETAAAGESRRGTPRRRRRPQTPAPLRQGRRPALRLRLGVHQVDARLRPGRCRLLPRRDARGRRGSAVHRPADGDLRVRGRRHRRPARAPRRGRGGARPRARRAAGGAAQPLAGGDLPRPRPEVERGALAIWEAREDVRKDGNLRPPTMLRDAPTRERRSSGTARATSTLTRIRAASSSTTSRGARGRRYYRPGGEGEDRPAGDVDEGDERDRDRQRGA